MSAQTFAGLLGWGNISKKVFLTAKMKSINIALEVPDTELVNFKEAVLMALMGYLRLEQIPNTIPTVTGAVKPTVGGCIYWADHFRKDKT